MNVPEGLKYTNEHVWLKIEDDKVRLGITDFAQDLLGEINNVELPEVGKMIKKDDLLITLESLKSVFDVLSPLNGKICEVNTALTDQPASINKTPFEQGWMVVLEEINTADLEGLLTSQDYQKHLSEIS